MRTITMFIKGTEAEALAECQRLEIEVLGHHPVLSAFQIEPTQVVRTHADEKTLLRVITWFCDQSDVPPYPPGTLLYYHTIVEDQEAVI